MLLLLELIGHTFVTTNMFLPSCTLWAYATLHDNKLPEAKHAPAVSAPFSLILCRVRLERFAVRARSYFRGVSAKIKIAKRISDDIIAHIGVSPMCANMQVTFKVSGFKTFKLF